jgi:hypothetical protein
MSGTYVDDLNRGSFSSSRSDASGTTHQRSWLQHGLLETSTGDAVRESHRSGSGVSQEPRTNECTHLKHKMTLK